MSVSGYFLENNGGQERARFACRRVSGFSDDDFAPRRAVEALARILRLVGLVQLRPRDLGWGKSAPLRLPQSQLQRGQLWRDALDYFASRLSGSEAPLLQGRRRTLEVDWSEVLADLNFGRN
ncbi:MAG: hypothetical protein R3B07_26085 [Polyangiaceae bacterium]